ncbi:hypothetical protein [Anaerosphaera multitolerans]|uniref:hypothetical protein n=1 Tax=Anaerosphaera multitolerans TaxID=2487351 RepID=UPI0013E338F7|nr:hypothetical protein [Anaerosphaera multitolerans]
MDIILSIFILVVQVFVIWLIVKAAFNSAIEEVKFKKVLKETIREILIEEGLIGDEKQ